MEGLVFVVSALPLAQDVIWASSWPFPWMVASCAVVILALSCAAFLAHRFDLVFPLLLMISLASRAHSHGSAWDACLCGLLLFVHEIAMQGRTRAWILAVLFSVLAPWWAWGSQIWWAVPLVYMLALEHFTWWPPFVHALDVAERHVCSCLLTAMVCHVRAWPSDDFSLPSFLVLGLIALGACLGLRGETAWHPAGFAGVTSAFAVAAFVCARLLAGHWMFAWAVQNLLAYSQVALLIVVVLGAGLAIIIWVVHERKDPLGFRDRKLFHALIVAVFSQAILGYRSSVWIPALTLASFAAFCLLYLIELGRVFSGTGNLINSWYGRWIDDRDSKALVATTHLQLLLGCAVPVWICGGDVAVAVCGLATIGVGDSMAAIVGSRWGRTRWSATNSRTLEGSFAMAASTAVAFLVLADGHLSAFSVVRISVCVAIMEAHTHSRDNLLLPLFAVSLIR